MNLLTSNAFKSLRERANGIDLGQLSMLTKRQFEHLITVISHRRQPTVLDLGCGAGKIAFTLAQETEGKVTGIDASPEFVAQAKDHFGDTITVYEGDFDELPNDLPKFDVIYSVDTLYFSKDLNALVANLASHLEPDGSLIVFWSQTVKSQEDKDTLEPDQTELALALRKAGMSYQYRDFTSEECEYWKKANTALRELEVEFKADKEDDFYEHFIKETDSLLESVEKKQISRYVYEATISKPEKP